FNPQVATSIVLAQFLSLLRGYTHDGRAQSSNRLASETMPGKGRRDTVCSIRYAVFRTFDLAVLGLDSGVGNELPPFQTGGPYEQCIRTGGTTATRDPGEP